MFFRNNRLPISARVVLVALTMWAVYSGGSKPEQPADVRISQLVMALAGGGLVDESGTIASHTALKTVQEFNAETSSIVSNADAIVAAALAEYTVITQQLAEADYSVVYVAYDFPRADPPETTNHNITATIEKVSQSGSTLSAFAYFSEQSETNVTLRIRASVAQDVWVTLDPKTNYWPATTDVGGLACYRYDYAIPTAMAGVPLRPMYDIAFGGYEPGQYLIVPSDGVIVSTNSVDCTPFTGWDYEHPEPWGTALAVRYVGGIAVEATLNGTNYAGVVTGEVAL